MISNLPILAGEKIKLVILHNPHFLRDKDENWFNTSGVCYSNTYLQPAFLPITGEYDDYGNIENIQKDWNYKIITNVLKKELGDTIIVDGEEKKDWKLEDILYGIERGDIRYTGIDRKEKKNKKFAQLMIDSMPKNEDDIVENNYVRSEYERCKELAEKELVPEEQNLNFSFVMIREDIWNHIIENYQGKYWNPERKNTDDDNPIYISAKKYYQYKFNQQVNKINKLFKEIDETPIEERDIFKYDFKIIRQNTIFNESYAGSGKLFSYEDYFNELYENVENNQDINHIFKQYYEMYHIDSYIGSIRKMWMIQAGSGSQHDGFKEHLILSNKVKEICDVKIKEREEWDKE